MRNLSFNSARAGTFCNPAKKGGVGGRIEVVGIIQSIVGQMRELSGICRAQFEAIVIITVVMPAQQPFAPEMLEPGRPVVASCRTERMEVFLAVALPVLELDTEFERRLRLAHELGFVDAKQTVEVDEWRDGCFAHSDCSDRIAFDECQIDRISHRFRERGRGHPACGSTASHYNAPGLIVAAHRLRVLKRNARI